MSPAKIIQLRELLAAKFPATQPKTSSCLPCEARSVDTALGGGLPLGGMTEVVCAAGGGLLLNALVRATLRRRGLLALIDAADVFDPAGVPANALKRLLWVRSQSVAQAVQAADLLLRDANLSLVILDLCAAPTEETRKVPATSWYRLQRVVEPTATAFVVLTRQPMVVAARPRLLLEARFSLDAFDRRQSDLLTSLRADLLRGQEESQRRYA